MNNNIPNELRPTCSCGTSMNLVKFEEHYDELLYWECQDKDCYLIDLIVKESLDIDRETRGGIKPIMCLSDIEISDIMDIDFGEYEMVITFAYGDKLSVGYNHHAGKLDYDYENLGKVTTIN